MTSIEIAVQDVTGARTARELGADRIELCGALSLGGLTPSAALVDAAVRVGPPVHVLIRPRAGGFHYSEAEAEVITADIERAVAAGAAGVVIGALDENGSPDLGLLRTWVEAAGGAEVTFHRALDLSGDVVDAATRLLGTGVRRILTSGGAPTAFEGRAALARLVERCGNEIEIQAGAGIDPTNVRAVAETGVSAVHFSAKRAVPPEPAGAGGVDFGGYETIDPALAAATIAALREG